MPCNYRVDGNRGCRPEIGEQMAEVSTAHLNIANTNATDAVSAPWPLGPLSIGVAAAVATTAPAGGTPIGDYGKPRICGIGPGTSPNTCQPFVSRFAVRRSNQQMQVPNAPACSHNQLLWSSKRQLRARTDIPARAKTEKKHHDEKSNRRTSETD